MSVITISRGSYSRGKEVAEALARELGYECISRDILLETSGKFNIPEIKLIRALHDAPSILERFSHGREQYISCFKSSFLSRMAEGNIVYHGLAGHFFLQRISHVLKVRINASMNDRVNEEVKREKCSKVDALYNLKKDDEERRKWSLQLYGKDTWDSRLYDMVLSVDVLNVGDIVEILANTVRSKRFQETEESRIEMQKRALLANIHALVTPFSPNAQIHIGENSTIELSNLDGRLRSDPVARQKFAAKAKDKFSIQKVLFKEPVRIYKGHINNFYNLDVPQ